jgi:hypothetical protein
LAAEVSPSYGWVHALVTYLAELGIVERQGLVVRLVDSDRLLDMVGVERPFHALQIGAISLGGRMAPGRVGTFLTKALGLPVEHAFCGMTAALHHGSAMRVPGRLQFYVREGRLLRNAVAHGILPSAPDKARAASTSTVLEVYSADRDIWDGVENRGGAPFVSFGQAFLDCAGLGSAGHRAVRGMVSRLGPD